MRLSSIVALLLFACSCGLRDSADVSASLDPTSTEVRVRAQSTIPADASSHDRFPAVEGGWSEFKPARGAQVVHVSSSDGKDSWPGTKRKPKRSIRAAVETLRHGKGDWLLLKRGDEFLEGLGQWKVSGESEDRPTVIGSYGRKGDRRPLLLTGRDGGLVTHGGGGSPRRIDHVVLMGLHFRAHEYDGRGEPTGVSWHQPSRGFLIEDCVFENYSTGLVIQAIDGRHENFRLRRSVVADCYNTSGGNPQGIYVVHVDGGLLEENVFDTNGWKPGLAGAGADIFSHNLYIDTNNSGICVRGNIIANGASHGVQMRSGGFCEDNLFLRNSIALMMAGREGPEGEFAVARGNAILDGKDIDAENLRGWGIDLNNVVAARIENNIIAHNVAGGFPIPILLDGDGYGRHVHEVEVRGNVVFNWGGSIQLNGDSSRLSAIALLDNVVQNERSSDALLFQNSAASSEEIHSSKNRFFSQKAGKSSWMTVEGRGYSLDRWRKLTSDRGSTGKRVRFPDSKRSIVSWQKKGRRPASHEAFMEEARQQSKDNWREEFTARAVIEHLREGFGIDD